MRRIKRRMIKTEKLQSVTEKESTDSLIALSNHLYLNKVADRCWRKVRKVSSVI